MEGARKRGRPHKRWRGEFSNVLNIMGIKTDRQGPNTVENGGRLYWKPMSTKEEEKENGVGDEEEQEETL